MRYLSVCSGIEAASVAWKQLGWQCAGVSEIEAFPRAVLQQRLGVVPVEFDDHRWTEGSNVTPLFGDFTKIEEHHVGPIDLLVGGTPCQSFSIAGKRLGLDDPRGNLTLEFLALARRLRPRWLCWENVPGVLSHDNGETFGTFLGLLAECGFERWAYRVLDAQYVRVGRFGRAVPQRRRRVFVVGYSGPGDVHPRAVLFDRESLRGDPAPRRQAGQGTAINVAPSLVGSGRGVERCGETRGQDPTIAVEGLAFGGNCTTGPIDVSTACNAHGGATGRIDFESETFVAHGPAPDDQQPYSIMPMNSGKDYKARETDVAPPVMGGGPFGGNQGGDLVVAPLPDAYAIQAGTTRENPDSGPDGVGVQSGCAYTLEARSEVQTVAHSLRADGFDASEDVTGRGTPLVPVAYQTSGNCGAWETGDVTGALDTGTDRCSNIVAFSAKDHGADAMLDCSPTLRAGGHTGSHANAGVMPAVAFEQEPYTIMERGREGQSNLEYRQDGTSNAILTPNGGRGGLGVGAVAARWGVRRLTPTECARLQAFPDDWARIEWRGKPADQCPDGPMYKAYGNSMAVNVMCWIGERIQQVDDAA